MNSRKSDLNYCLKYFVLEIRKTNGEKYPPRTLKEIVAMVQHYFSHGLSKAWSVFTDDFGLMVLDSEMKALARAGYVKEKKRAEVITVSKENELWERNILGKNNPHQLAYSLVYCLGLHLSLRAGKEHHDLVFGENS